MKLGADFEAMVAESSRLDAVTEGLDDRVTAVRVRVEDLLASGWTGEAATQFRPLFEAWVSAATNSTAQLSALVEALRGATADIVATEQANEDTVQSLTAAVPSSTLRNLMGEGL